MKRMLADVCPELINEWSQRNLPLTPDSVTHGSNKIVWWNGKCGHEWRASIKNRVISGSGCPYCSHNAILEGYNDLASQKPELAAEWSARNAPNYSGNQHHHRRHEVFPRMMPQIGFDLPSAKRTKPLQRHR